LKRTIFPILVTEKLKTHDKLPLYVNEKEEFDYRVFSWDENFLSHVILP
jgi:hypothetical protein